MCDFSFSSLHLSIKFFFFIGKETKGSSYKKAREES